MFQFQVTVKDMLLKRRFQRALRTFQDLHTEMGWVGNWLIEDARARLLARKSRISIGRLAKSLECKAYQRAVVISSVLPYARIQQEGGTVRPRKRKFLAIPLQEDLARIHMWPRMWAPGQLVRIKNILWEVDKKTGNLLRACYVLVKQAVIPGRPYLVKSDALIRFMRQVIADKLKRAAG